MLIFIVVAVINDDSRPLRPYDTLDLDDTLRLGVTTLVFPEVQYPQILAGKLGNSVGHCKGVSALTSQSSRLANQSRKALNFLG